MVRIPPHEQPLSTETAAILERMLPPGAEPLRIMRTFVRNREMTRAMGQWIQYELSQSLSVDLRAREIVIDRTCALCHCEYQWGLHVAVWAERAALTTAQIRSLTFGTSADPCWTEPRDRVLIQLTDQLHDTSDIDDDLWGSLSGHFSHEQVLDLLALCGWYHAVCYLVRAARVEREPGIPCFADLPPDAGPHSTGAQRP
jgi:hypothetical protein